MTPETAPQPRRNVIPRDAAARLIMVSPKHLDRLVREGWIRKADRAQFEVVEVVQGYIRSLTSSTERSQPTAQANRVRDARAREIEGRISQRDAELISFAEHEEILRELLTTIGEAAEAFPAGLRPELRQAAAQEVAEVMEKTNERVAELNAGLRPFGSIERAPE